MANDFSYEIVEHIAVLSTSKTGWTKELNLISWNGRTPKYDIREWSPEHMRRWARALLFPMRSSQNSKSL